MCVCMGERVSKWVSEWSDLNEWVKEGENEKRTTHRSRREGIPVGPASLSKLINNHKILQ